LLPRWRVRVGDDRPPGRARGRSHAHRARDRRVHGLDGRRPVRLDAADTRGRNPGGYALMAIDPVTLTVLGNAFVNICREMGVTMTRTSLSPTFNARLHCSCL